MNKFELNKNTAAIVEIAAKRNLNVCYVNSQAHRASKVTIFENEIAGDIDTVVFYEAGGCIYYVIVPTDIMWIPKKENHRNRRVVLEADYSQTAEQFLKESNKLLVNNFKIPEILKDKNLPMLISFAVYELINFKEETKNKTINKVIEILKTELING